LRTREIGRDGSRDRSGHERPAMHMGHNDLLSLERWPAAAPCDELTLFNVIHQLIT
jgi:hypothetical protein